MESYYLKRGKFEISIDGDGNIHKGIIHPSKNIDNECFRFESTLDYRLKDEAYKFQSNYRIALESIKAVEKMILDYEKNMPTVDMALSDGFIRKNSWGYMSGETIIENNGDLFLCYVPNMRATSGDSIRFIKLDFDNGLFSNRSLRKLYGILKYLMQLVIDYFREEPTYEVALNSRTYSLSSATVSSPLCDPRLEESIVTLANGSMFRCWHKNSRYSSWESCSSQKLEYEKIYTSPYKRKTIYDSSYKDLDSFLCENREKINSAVDKLVEDGFEILEIVYTYDFGLELVPDFSRKTYYAHIIYKPKR